MAPVMAAILESGWFGKPLLLKEASDLQGRTRQICRIKFHPAKTGMHQNPPEDLAPVALGYGQPPVSGNHDPAHFIAQQSIEMRQGVRAQREEPVLPQEGDIPLVLIARSK
jgi:hypothetical protein